MNQATSTLQRLGPPLLGVSGLTLAPLVFPVSLVLGAVGFGIERQGCDRTSIKAINGLAVLAGLAIAFVVVFLKP